MSMITRSSRISRGHLALAIGVLLSIGVSVLIPACGAGAPPAGGTDNLPNSNAGPFRVLKTGETKGKAPLIVGSARARAPSLVDVDGDPSTFALVLFASERNPGFPARITRRYLPDGRTPDDSTADVLVQSESWEDVDEGLSDPAAMLVGGRWWLFYASGGCIGRATSDDGKAFTKDASPVLCASDQAGAWDASALSGPSVHVGYDKRFHLLYGASGKIGEAIADKIDGTFSREGAAPVLTPSSASQAATFDGGIDGGTDEPFDGAWIGDPFAMLATSSLGRPLTLVYYSAINEGGGRSIGLAGRYGDDGALERNEIPALARFHAQAPSVIRFAAFDLLMCSGDNKEGLTATEPTIIGALAPATAGWPYPKDAGAD